jgi:hypothetical protein
MSKFCPPPYCEDLPPMQATQAPSDVTLNMYALAWTDASCESLPPKLTNPRLLEKIAGAQITVAGKPVAFGEDGTATWSGQAANSKVDVGVTAPEYYTLATTP